MLSPEMKSPPRKSGNENFDISPLPSASPKRTALPRPGRAARSTSATKLPSAAAHSTRVWVPQWWKDQPK